MLWYNPPMTHLPMDIGEGIPEDARKGALEVGAWMAAHPEAAAEEVGRHRKCREAYIRELETGKRPDDPPEGYAKYVKYMGRTVRSEWEAGKAAREAELAERKAKRERVWTVFERILVVIGGLASVATIAGIVVSLIAA